MSDRILDNEAAVSTFLSVTSEERGGSTHATLLRRWAGELEKQVFMSLAGKMPPRLFGGAIKQ